MSTERKYRKRLNRNGWMAKIQRFTWGSKTPDFMGYCPFFWFTWLSLIIAPFKLLVIGLVIIVIVPFVGIYELWTRLPHRPTKPTYEKLLRIHEYILEMGEEKFLEYTEGDDIGRWIEITPDWRNCVAAAVAIRDRKEERVQASAKRDKRRLQWLANRLHYVIKPVAYTTCAVAAFFAVRFIVRFIAWAWPLINWPKVGQIVEIIGIMLIEVVVSGAIVTGIVFSIEYLWKYYRRKCPKCPNKIGFWRKLGSYLAIPFSFLGETIDVIYTRECPLIEWGDDSGPIENTTSENSPISNVKRMDWPE